MAGNHIWRSNLYLFTVSRLNCNLEVLFFVEEGKLDKLFEEKPLRQDPTYELNQHDTQVIRLEQSGQISGRQVLSLHFCTLPSLLPSTRQN